MNSWIIIAGISMILNLWMLWILIRTDLDHEDFLKEINNKLQLNGRLIQEMMECFPNLSKEKESLKKALDEYDYENGRL